MVTNFFWLVRLSISNTWIIYTMKHTHGSVSCRQWQDVVHTFQQSGHHLHGSWPIHPLVRDCCHKHSDVCKGREIANVHFSHCKVHSDVPSPIVVHHPVARDTRAVEGDRIPHHSDRWRWHGYIHCDGRFYQTYRDGHAKVRGHLLYTTAETRQSLCLHHWYSICT